jgi:predicted transcriptional regulator
VEELSLPDAELDVMACLWERGPMTARAIREALDARRPMSHASISTLLARLMEKGYVTRTKADVGKAFVFRAVREPRATRRRLVSELLDRVFGGSGVALVSSLLEAKALSPGDVEEVARLFETMREKSKSVSTKPSKKRSAKCSNPTKEEPK